MIALPIPASNTQSKYLSDEDRRLIESSLTRVVDWIQRNRYLGYEPADGNASVLFPFTFGRVLPMRVLQQVVLRTPFNIRPFIGVRRHESAIARGYLAAGYLSIYRRTGIQSIGKEARACLDWLMANRASGYDEFCWGDPYDYATRSGRRPRGEPLLIWSALIGQAFLDGAKVLREEKYFGVATSIARWIQRLPAERTNSGLCLSYVTYRQSSIHNSNMMGAAFLGRVGALTGDPSALAGARAAMEYSCSRQRRNGSWFYAEEPKYHWIDNFHTGYNLSALKAYRAATGDHDFDHHLEKGLEYYAARFFEKDGRPRYFDNSTYPVDIQCAAQSIETLASFADQNPACGRQARDVAKWTIERLQHPDGHFCYRDLGWTTVSTPMMHWGQGTMTKALAVLLEKSQ